MKCPDCSRALIDVATSCRCGWVRSGNAAQPLGYQQCEWEAETRCMYPGSISSNIKEGGPYFCRLHFGCKDPLWGSQIVEASKDYRHPTEQERVAEATRKALASLEAQGMSRQPNESFEAYRKRTGRFLREKFAGINKAA